MKSCRVAGYIRSIKEKEQEDMSAVWWRVVDLQVTAGILRRKNKRI